MRFIFFLLLNIIAFANCFGQYLFTGHVDKDKWQGPVFLSYVEDYRMANGIYRDQIIGTAEVDSLGYFEFHGNELENANRIYRIHVDNCSISTSQHFNDACDENRAILFIANNNDTINFPVSFEDQTFCEVISTNSSTASLMKIDSLKEIMKFEFADFQSEANNKLNNKKWFKNFQDYGEQLKEPLAELYAYQYLTNRSNETYQYYLQDLKSNNYYPSLQQRLNKVYPQSTYLQQFDNELKADEFLISKYHESLPNWVYVIIILLCVSIILNVYYFSNSKSKSSNDPNLLGQLTPQESKILDLILLEKTNKEIADLQFISVSTVKTHINNIYRKLKINSREEAKQLFG